MARRMATKLKESLTIMLFMVLVTSGLIIIRIPMVIQMASRSCVKYITRRPIVIARAKRRAWRIYIFLRLKFAPKTSLREFLGEGIFNFSVDFSLTSFSLIIKLLAFLVDCAYFVLFVVWH